MCDPGMMGQTATGAQAIGTAASAWGAYQQKAGEKYAYDVQAQVAANNAQIARWGAQDAVTRGENALAQHQLKAAQLKGTQRVSMAERGLDLRDGSALDILTDTDFMGKIDSGTITDNAAKEAWGYRVQATNYDSNAMLLRERAKDTSPGMAALGTLLTGAGQVASTWYSLADKGAFSKPKVRSGGGSGGGSSWAAYGYGSV